jgi:Trypsin-like peptidase domain
LIASTNAAPKLSYADVDSTIMPSVATVTGVQNTENAGIQIFQGSSGFVIHPQERLILTSCRILFGDWRTLTITVEFGGRPPVKRSAEPLVCDNDLDLAIVRVREVAPNLPPPILPPSPDELAFDEGLYILGFVSIVPVIVPAVIEQKDATIPGLSGTFIRTRSNLAPSTASAKNIEDMLHDMSDLIGGPLIDTNGKLVGVNAFSSLGDIKSPRRRRRSASFAGSASLTKQ